ncbi:mucin-13-like [Palaemon carinicauda]|uniref:mucin-13-like n=1 Tax=Palaemon carinicauda TaxID=392227 RepID=UPI0035B5D7E6
MKEKKNGADQPQRSAHDDQIIETWSFLIQHIIRGETHPSEQIAVPELAAVTVSDGDDDEVRSTGSHSQASTSTGKGKDKGKRSSPPSTQTATTKADTLGDPQRPQSSPKQNPWRPTTRTPASTRSYTIFDACWKATCMPSRRTKATLQAPPKQQQQQPQQQPTASLPSPVTWMPPQSLQSSGQSSWACTTEWQPGIPLAPSAPLVQNPSPTTSVSSATLVQAPSPTPSVSSLSATYKTPVTPLSFLVLTPGSVENNQGEGIPPSSLYTSKVLNTLPVHWVSPHSGTTTSKDTD